MARMSGSKHLKRLAAPRFWPILRKEAKWVVKVSPGPHRKEFSLPLLVVVKELLHIGETNAEVRKVIAEGHIKIDGVIRKNYKFPVGFMDVIEVVDTGEFFRAIPMPVRFLGLIPITQGEATYKVQRIESKSTVKGGHIQLGLYDGRNLLINVRDPEKPEEDRFKTMSSVKIKVPGNELLDYYPLERGSIVIVIGGRNVGRVARLDSIAEGMRHYRKIVTLEDFKGNKFYTTLDKIMVIGREKPEITLPEGAM